MHVGIIAPSDNQSQRNFNSDLIKKIEAIGFQVSLVKSDKLNDLNVLVVVFDGRNLQPTDYILLGLFKGLRQKSQVAQLIIGYQITDNDYLGAEEKYLNHLAKTELNLISCLKDYIYYHQHGQGNS